MTPLKEASLLMKALRPDSSEPVFPAASQRAGDREWPSVLQGRRYPQQRRRREQRDYSTRILVQHR